jgi:hypothetical protein
MYDKQIRYFFYVFFKFTELTSLIDSAQRQNKQISQLLPIQNLAFFASNISTPATVGIVEEGSIT